MESLSMLQQQQQRRMEGEPASKRSRLEHHRGFSDGSSFHMEDLPEEIQPLVLSLLSLKEAASTSLVSKNWRKLWTRTWLEEDNNKVLGHVFHGIPSISAVKVLHVHASMHTNYPVWSSQVHTLTTRPACMFLNLRHLTYEILFFTKAPNRYSGILQLSQYLAFAPQLETLELHMLYHVSVSRCWHGEGVSYSMHRHDHLKTVYMSGFRCYRAQVELLCSILEMGAVLEQVTIEPMVRIPYSCDLLNLGIPRDKIYEWAHRTSERFGKVITVAERPEQRCSYAISVECL
ncbi:unnamed protein product [Urochloa decumbens]|uniref:F-box domain-containing protein n=1 Tax=Urochloa decumbens TaxID=240449 RepID=A0ABC9B844_9POAL